MNNHFKFYSAQNSVTNETRIIRVGKTTSTVYNWKTKEMEGFPTLTWHESSFLVYADNKVQEKISGIAWTLIEISEQQALSQLNV